MTIDFSVYSLPGWWRRCSPLTSSLGQPLPTHGAGRIVPAKPCLPALFLQEELRRFQLARPVLLFQVEPAPRPAFAELTPQPRAWKEAERRANSVGSRPVEGAARTARSPGSVSSLSLRQKCRTERGGEGRAGAGFEFLGLPRERRVCL